MATLKKDRQQVGLCNLDPPMRRQRLLQAQGCELCVVVNVANPPGQGMALHLLARQKHWALDTETQHNILVDVALRGRQRLGHVLANETGAALEKVAWSSSCHAVLVTYRSQHPTLLHPPGQWSDTEAFGCPPAWCLITWSSHLAFPILLQFPEERHVQRGGKDLGNVGRRQGRRRVSLNLVAQLRKRPSAYVALRFIFARLVDASSILVCQKNHEVAIEQSWRSHLHVLPRIPRCLGSRLCPCRLP